MRFAATGQTNRQIAEQLFLSVRTVEKHRQGGDAQAGVRHREDLTKYALRHGLIDPEE